MIKFLSRLPTVLLFLSLNTFAGGNMNLGQFSVSLEVKDIRKSYDFYQKLGFHKIAGVIEQNWLILKNDSNQTVIGIFQDQQWHGQKLTFNPVDVRSIEKELKASGVVFETETTGETGPAWAELKDPDGNVILLDQHF